MSGRARQIRYQMYDSKNPFIIFWAIVIAVDAVFYILNSIFGNHFGVVNGNLVNNTFNISVTGGNIISIFIFIIVYNMIIYYESFPVSINFSSTRKDFYTGVITHNLILCLSMAVIQGILFKLDGFVVKLMGAEPLNNFLFFNLQKDNIIFLIAGLFLIFMVMNSIFNLLGTLSYKFGYMMWIVMAVLFVMFANITVLGSAIGRVFWFILAYNGFWLFMTKTLLFSALLYGIAWTFVRRMNIRTSKAIR